MNLMCELKMQDNQAAWNLRKNNLLQGHGTKDELTWVRKYVEENKFTTRYLIFL